MSRLGGLIGLCRKLRISGDNLALSCSCSRGSLVRVEKIPARLVHSTCLLAKAEDRKAMMASLPKKDEGTQGERLVDVDSSHIAYSMFPDVDTPNLLFDGVRFSDLPICHVRCSMNNTLLYMTDAKGRPMMFKSGGTEGYKNSRKGTTVAAQAAALSMCAAALARSISNVRVVVKGLGPGRLASVKGLQMGGLNVVSITDHTHAPDRLTLRPRKAKRL